MKKGWIAILICMLTLTLSPIKAEEAEEQPALANQAQSAYVMEYSTGQVVFKKNETEKLYPASMTKMMGLILIFEALNNGSLSMEDTVTVSETAASMGGSQIFLEVNEVMKVEDMIKSICIASANDAMVAMAEKLGGSVENFVKKMNDKGKEIGLENTHFVNTTGLHDPEHYSCAKDMARIAQVLIQTGGDQLLAITSTYDTYIREDSEKPFWLVNTNKLIKQMEGVDGLKTGFTQEAMSCITVTAKRDNLRLISVVMKEPSSQVRNAETKQLLDYGFAMFDQKIIYEKGSVIDALNIDLAKPERAELVTLNEVPIVFKIGEEPQITEQKVVLIKNELPYAVDEKIAELVITLDNQTTLTVDLGVNVPMEKVSYFDLFLNLWKQVLA